MRIFVFILSLLLSGCASTISEENANDSPPPNVIASDWGHRYLDCVKVYAEVHSISSALPQDIADASASSCQMAYGNFVTWMTETYSSIRVGESYVHDPRGKAIEDANQFLLIRRCEIMRSRRTSAAPPRASWGARRWKFTNNTKPILSARSIRPKRSSSFDMTYFRWSKRPPGSSC